MEDLFIAFKQDNLLAISVLETNQAPSLPPRSLIPVITPLWNALPPDAHSTCCLIFFKSSCSIFSSVTLHPQHSPFLPQFCSVPDNQGKNKKLPKSRLFISQCHATSVKIELISHLPEMGSGTPQTPAHMGIRTLILRDSIPPRCIPS